MSLENNVEPADGKPSSDEPRYVAIRDTLETSSWGRWFLREHGKRAGAEARRPLLKMLSQLEAALQRGALDAGRVDRDPSRVLEHIAREMAGVLGNGTDGAKARPLPALIAELDGSAASLREASERLQEVAWDLRGDGAKTESCDALDDWTTKIARSSGAQAEAVRRLGEILRLIERLDKRLTLFRDVDPVDVGRRSRKVVALADHGSSATEGPVADRDSSAASDKSIPRQSRPFALDDEPRPSIVASGEARTRIKDDEASADLSAAVVPEATRDIHAEEGVIPETDVEGRRREWFAAFAEIDALDLREKLRLFT